MKRSEFMSRLSDLLKDMQEGEREEALQYYNDYLDDAGEENEESVIDSLGSPESVAASIKNGASGENGEFTEKGYFDSNNTAKNEVTQRVYYGNEADAHGKQEKKPLSGIQIALIVIACVIFSPLILSGFGVVVAIIAAVFGIAIAAVAVVVSLLVAAIAIIAAGMGMLFTGNPLTGGCLIGASLVIFSLFLVFLWLVVCFIGVVIPGLFKLVGRLFGKRGEAK